MDFSFEVRETDLGGRIGRMRVGKKVLETPYLFPVIHPVRQLVSPAELLSMGFNGLMTNSYIIHSRRRQEALERGIHGMLGFDGVFMTDSGGYQVLRYGDLEVDYAQVAGFQADIGSELAVTLDRPTGFSESRSYAEGTVEYSLKNALATLKEFGQRDTTWVGPVQGGLFPKLVARSARGLTAGGFAFLALGSPVQVMENYRFAELAGMIVAAKRAIPYSMPLHLFGAGHPLTMALAIALGCDTFDSASYVLFARGERYMTDRGVSRLRSMKYLPCSCPVCGKTSVAGLLELGREERTRELSLHNLFVLRKELETCKEALVEGRLWDLVQERAAAHPKVFEALGAFSGASDILASGTPPLKERGLFVRGAADHSRPELEYAAEGLKRALRRGSVAAVLADTGGSVPLAKLPGRRRIPADADVYLFHPTLGPYPAELEYVYPFTQTVVAAGVSRDLDGAVRTLRGMGYGTVYVAVADAKGKATLRRLRSTRKPRDPYPSAPSSSSRPRSPRRP